MIHFPTRKSVHVNAIRSLRSHTSHPSTGGADAGTLHRPASRALKTSPLSRVLGLLPESDTSSAEYNIRVNTVHPCGVATPMIFNEAVAKNMVEHPEGNI